MEQGKEVRNGKIEWRIDKSMNTQKDGHIKSSEFKFGRYNCYLFIPTCFKGSSSEGVREIHLISENCPVDDLMFSEATVYELSLIDRYKKEFLTTKGITHGENKIIMMVLCMDYVKKYQNELLTEGGNFTFRLSWHPQRDASVHNVDTQTLPDLKSEVEPKNLLETLSNDLKCFYESQVDTDCVLKVGDTKFPVHRAFLSARSTVFSAMFRHDLSESRTGEVDIRDVEATSMGDVLHYIYSGKIRGLNEDTAVRMYTLADKYALIELRYICLRFLMDNLTTDNLCDVAVLAHTHAETELEYKIVEFIEGRLDDFEESDSWIQFSKSKPLLALKLVRSAWKASKKRETKK